MLVGASGCRTYLGRSRSLEAEPGTGQAGIAHCTSAQPAQRIESWVKLRPDAPCSTPLPQPTSPALRHASWPCGCGGKQRVRCLGRHKVIACSWQKAQRPTHRSSASMPFVSARRSTCSNQPCVLRHLVLRRDNASELLGPTSKPAAPAMISLKISCEGCCPVFLRCSSYSLHGKNTVARPHLRARADLSNRSLQQSVAGLLPC